MHPSPTSPFSESREREGRLPPLPPFDLANQFVEMYPQRSGEPECRDYLVSITHTHDHTHDNAHPYSHTRQHFRQHFNPNRHQLEVHGAQLLGLLQHTTQRRSVRKSMSTPTRTPRQHIAPGTSEEWITSYDKQSHSIFKPENRTECF